QLSESPPGAPRRSSGAALPSPTRTLPSALKSPWPRSAPAPVLPASCRRAAPQSSERVGASQPPLRSCDCGPAPGLAPGVGTAVAVDAASFPVSFCVAVAVLAASAGDGAPSSGGGLCDTAGNWRAPTASAGA